MAPAWNFLDLIWSESRETHYCYHCGQIIAHSAVLARTFTLRTLDNSQATLRADIIDFPKLLQAIVIRHRHLSCLLDTTQFIAVSHVWHKQVTSVQAKGLKTAEYVAEAAKIVSEVPVKICLEFAKHYASGEFEIWHDYISVPQWDAVVKRRIIPAIPELFRRATLTLVYLADIGTSTFTKMRAPRTVEERVHAISDICNAEWFSRVWTAMELTQSREIRVMSRDFTVIEAHPERIPFFQELRELWEVEVRRCGHAQSLEWEVDINHNLVPWQLSSLDMVRTQNLHGEHIPLGVAFEVLIKRRLTVSRDFFHALLGIVKPGLSFDQLSHDFRKALSQIAIACLRKGDFSPLLMIPASRQRYLRLIVQGFTDLATWGIGGFESPPTHPVIQQSLINPTTATIKAENLGTVQFVWQIDGQKYAPIESLSELFQLALRTNGPNPYDFVDTFAVRLFGQQHEQVVSRLRRTRCWDRLQVEITILHKSLFVPHASNRERTHAAVTWIADAMGLSNNSLGGNFLRETGASPMGFLRAHGSTIHGGDSKAIAAVRCHKCGRTFLLRFALLAPSRDIFLEKNVSVHRIPGLKYEFTLSGGTGFILREGQMIGRFLWASRTCKCDKLEDVDVKLDDFRLPEPNMFEYGKRRDHRATRLK